MASVQPPRSTPPAGATPALIRWGAVVGGAVIGLALLVLLSVLSLALAVGTGVTLVESNLSWFLAGAVVVALFLAGLLAGWLSGVPGFAPGLFNGITVWGVVLLVSLAVGAPDALQTVELPTSGQAVQALAPQGEVLWAVFWGLLVGAVAAGLAGGLGGLATRPAFVYAAPPTGLQQPGVGTDPLRTADPANAPAHAGR